MTFELCYTCESVTIGKYLPCNSEDVKIFKCGTCGGLKYLFYHNKEVTDRQLDEFVEICNNMRNNF